MALPSATYFCSRQKVSKTLLGWLEPVTQIAKAKKLAHQVE